jgi:broad specificity phosphatase PhoE
MVSLELQTVYSSEEQTSVETAQIVAARTGAERKTVAELAEVSFGLWKGLTTEDLKRRYPKTFKKWRNDPSSVCPPEGEDMEVAYQRLDKVFHKLTNKPEGSSTGVVLGPLALALARCRVELVELARAHQMAQDEPLRYERLDSGAWHKVETPQAVAREATEQAAVEPGGEQMDG